VTADTIYAVSTGAPPAAIAVVRISGPRADAALQALAGRLPPPRRANLAVLRTAEGEELDRALVLRFPGPASATGEDVTELHLHGGRAVAAAVLQALSRIDGLRAAEPGEFTRRAFENGRIDLAEAEGLADLLQAETEAQRRSALAMAGGALSRRVEEWRQHLLALAAGLEAALDFSDEGEVGEAWPTGWRESAEKLSGKMASLLALPSAERLRDGVRAVVAGPPNAGKSSLFNVLAGRDAAIVADRAGTTRDLVEAPTGMGGFPFLLVDTAGLRDSSDAVEAMGIERARGSVAAADIVLWLGEPAEAPERSITIQSKSDLRGAASGAELRVSVVTGEGVPQLVERLAERAGELLPREGEVAATARQREAIAMAQTHLIEAAESRDMLVAAEALRQARGALDRVTGRAGVEDMLDALFGRFCIGK
jgi:tRNA modification GTPase